MSKIPKEYMIAIDAVVKASSKIMKVYNESFDVEIKGDGSPLTIADLESSKIIEIVLQETQIPITGEETKKVDYEIRKTWNKSWCVDPLDGTKEFVNRNGEFAVNIALIEKQTPIFGLIASPVSEQILFGDKDLGVFIFSFNDAENPLNWKKIKEHSSNKIKEFNIKGTLNSQARELSGGNQQKLQLSLIPDQKGLLAIEQPTRGLDLNSTQSVWNKINERINDDICLFFSTTDIDEVWDQSDWIISFSGEKITDISEKKNIKKSDIKYFISGVKIDE